jgi:hypothetical protein
MKHARTLRDAIAVATFATIGSLAPSAFAQVLSPSFAATQSGVLSYEGPGYAARGRWQQRHADLRQMAFTFSSIAFRPHLHSEDLGVHVGATTLELWIGLARPTPFTTDVVQNFAAPPTLVMSRSTFDFPGSTFSPALPPAFTAVLPFDQPYRHPGGADLVWLLAHHGSTSWMRYDGTIDFGNGNFGFTHGTSTPQGSGCKTQNGPMTLRADASTSQSQHRISWRLVGAPSSSSVVVLFGAPIAVPISGFCGPTLWTNGALGTDVELASPIGRVAWTTSYVTPIRPAAVGVTLAAQAVAFADRTPTLPMWLSNGSHFAIPPQLPPSPFTTVLDFGSVASVHPGMGVVVRFQ